MKINYVFNDIKNQTMIPFIIHDETIRKTPTEWEFENCTVSFSHIKDIREKVEWAIVSIDAADIAVVFTDEQSEKIINGFLSKYNIAKENILRLEDVRPITQSGKISILIKETEVSKISDVLSIYVISLNSHSMSCGYRYEFEYLDVYPLTVEQFERAKSMDLVD